MTDESVYKSHVAELREIARMASEILRRLDALIQSEEARRESDRAA